MIAVFGFGGRLAGVFGPRFQYQDQLDAGDPVEEILPERLVTDGLLQVLTGGGQDAHIHAGGAALAEALVLALLGGAYGNATGITFAGLGLGAKNMTGIQAVGLGARDTLRLEAGMNLYGNDMDETTSPLEAGLGWIVKLKNKGDFIGRDVLERQKAEGVDRRLVGFEMLDRGIARHGYPVMLSNEGSEPVGFVTSGTQSPSLGKALGMAYLPTEATEVGTEFFIQIRKRTAPARVVELPFYSRKK